MFDKIGLAAEKMALSMSRRCFLGRLGRRAVVAAAGLMGLLTFPGVASAAKCPPGQQQSKCPEGFYICCPKGYSCKGSGMYVACYWGK